MPVTNFPNPFSYFRRHRPHASIGQINVQGQQFIGRCEISFGRMIHLVPEMNSFLVAIQDPGCEAKRVAFVNLLDISNVHIGDEGRGVGFCLVVVRKLEKFQHGVRRVIEGQDIERNVHVPIVIDPFRSNRFFVEREWCWNIVGVHRAKLWLGSPRWQERWVWRLKSRQSDLRIDNWNSLLHSPYYR